ncbi:MAG: hypothetical protein OK455_07735 [Thaumarchaeota archaeon]|nr:hypothetical protein [Nitrososphaerota archaeon]
MAVARLSKVTLESPRSELGVLLGRLMEFKAFHPSRREGMEQDIGLLVLGSKAQAVYGRVNQLLEKGGFGGKGRPNEVEKFEARDVEGLVSTLDGYVGTIEGNTSLFNREEDRTGVVNVLLAAQEASLMVFTNLQRILVFPQVSGSVKFEGFVPTKSIKAFQAMVGEFVSAIEPVKTQTKDQPYIPSLLVNPRVVSLFESITLQRGLPRYGEVDPTPILALIFPFFFGVMFADVGHGIALFAFGLYLIYKTAYKNWGELVLVLALSTTIFGFIRGSVFGVTFASPLSGVIPLPPAFSAGFTLSYIPFLLELAVVIGTFHLASGYAISFINHERAGNYRDAFLNRLPTIALYVSIVPFSFALAGTNLDVGVLFTSAAPTPVFNELFGLQIPVSVTARFSLPFVVAASLVLVIGHPLQEYRAPRRLRHTLRALGVGMADAVAKLLEFFMNTLSYLRLGVLLITTTLLGSLTAGVLLDGIPGVVVAVLLNVAVIGLEGVVVYIQDMRLQLYEWFSSFYEGDGTPFIPLVSGGKHFRMIWT